MHQKYLRGARRLARMAALLLPLLALAALGGCSGKSDDTSGGTGGTSGKSAPSGDSSVIQGAGATFPAPIYSKWFAAYKTQAGASVDYQAVGSGQGYTALKSSTVDFAASDAPLTDNEEKELSGPVVHIPTVGGAVALTYNLPGVPTGLKLSSDIIADIFLGKIKTWNDARITSINPGVNLPGTAITSVHRTDGSGTTYIFTNYLAKVSDAWKTGPGANKSVNWPAGLGGKGSAGVAAEVKRAPGSVGYVELAYALENKLPYASIKNHDGEFVAPSADSTSAAIGQYVNELKTNIKTPTVDAPGKTSYPICSVTYILLLKSAPRNTAAAVKLWQWAMDPAQQKQASELNYAPLPDEVLKLNLDTLKTVGAK